MERTERWVRYLITFLWVCLFMAITGCDNTRQSIGISTKPLQSGEDFEIAQSLIGKLHGERYVLQNLKKMKINEVYPYVSSL